MPRTIRNIYRQGLPSKIYFLAYSEPKSMYKISQQIYDIPKGFGRPQKLYKYRDQLKEDGGLIKLKSAKDRWQATPNPVINEIEIKISKKNLELDYFEKKLLKKILNSSFFRKYLNSYPQNISGEFDGMEVIFQTFDLLLFTKLNWMKENARKYIKKTKHPPYPLNKNESKIMVKKYEKMKLDEKKEILKDTKKGMKSYQRTQEILKPFKVSFDKAVDDIFQKPKDWGFYSFLYPDFLLKLLMNKEKKEWESLSSMGRLYYNIIFQSHVTKDIGKFLLPRAKEYLSKKRKN